MSRICSVTSKRRQVGNKVSHANNKRKKVWEVNLRPRRLFDSETGKWVSIKVSARVLKTIDKKGLSATLRDMGLTVSDLQ
ncbi:50S ribosomal protein L28 [bacterium]|nr:50S ribosomal protein L28 [bacterium]